MKVTYWMRPYVTYCEFTQLASVRFCKSSSNLASEMEVTPTHCDIMLLNAPLRKLNVNLRNSHLSDFGSQAQI